MPDLIEKHQKTVQLRHDYLLRKEALNHQLAYHSVLHHIQKHMQPSALREREGRKAHDYVAALFRRIYNTDPPTTA